MTVGNGSFGRSSEGAFIKSPEGARGFDSIDIVFAQGSVPNATRGTTPTPLSSFNLLVRGEGNVSFSPASDGSNRYNQLSASFDALPSQVYGVLTQSEGASGADSRLIATSGPDQSQWIVNGLIVPEFGEGDFAYTRVSGAGGWSAGSPSNGDDFVRVLYQQTTMRYFVDIRYYMPNVSTHPPGIGSPTDLAFTFYGSAP